MTLRLAASSLLAPEVLSTPIWTWDLHSIAMAFQFFEIGLRILYKAKRNFGNEGQTANGKAKSISSKNVGLVQAFTDCNMESLDLAHTLEGDVYS
jgi:hypothetical protein